MDFESAARRVCAGATLLLSTACTTYDPDYPKPESRAFASPSETRLGRLFSEEAAAHPGLSGVDVIRYGRVAFTARLAAADLAERSLDLQYYIWDADVTGRLLAERLVRAADRGVRVRVLLDDHSIRGRDTALADLSGHPNISIRAFNPYRDRSRVGDLFTEPSRVNRRSHNKIFVADGALAIVGGRNIADHYFGTHGESNYRDLDMWAVGDVVAEVASVFDAFWNSEFAVPYVAFVDEERRPGRSEAAVAAMRARMAEDPLPYPVDEDVAALTAYLEGMASKLVWAPTRVLYDDPSKAEDREVRGIVGELVALTSEAEREILIENAYFVPRDPMLPLVEDLTERGVRVRVLTNSMASNDVAAVVSGYQKYRKELLERGMVLYELRPDSSMKSRWSLISSKSRSGLHTKAMVVDREHVVIGSYNLDPRSADINSEAALLVDSPEFGERVGAYLDDGVSPENAYRVRLEDGDLVWTAEEGGEVVSYDTEPETGWWQRFTVSLMRLLPIQAQL